MTSIASLIAKRSMAAVLLVGSAGFADEAAANEVVYGCEDGITFNATFDNSAAKVTLDFDVGLRIVLDQAMAASGIPYAGGGYELYGKGEWANLVRPDQPELRCKVSGK